MNTRQQGAVAVAKAITWFTVNGYSVSVPITDSQRYDLVVDKAGRLYRVEVKSGEHIRQSGSYQVTLVTKGGNKTGTGKKTVLSLNDCDLVFICAGSNQYLFPAEILDGRSSINLPSKYEDYIIQPG